MGAGGRGAPRHVPEIVLGEGDFLRAVSDTVWHIESYDITSVRASVGNLLVSRYVRDHSDDTVIFVGDVADELFASYRGFSQAPDPGAFDRANRDMLFNIHRFDVLRSDRTISGAGLEARVPFGDIDLMQFWLDRRHKMFREGHRKLFFAAP